MTNEINTSGIDLDAFDEYLEHHGIKGMHWGIRRTPEQLGHIISRKKEKFEKYAEKAGAYAEKGKVKKFNKYQKKTEKTNKRITKLNKTLEKALKRQSENDEQIVKKGSVDDVLAISDRLSEDQINRAIKRIQNQQKLEGLKPDGMTGLDKVVKLGGKVAEGSKHAFTIADNISKFKGVMDEMRMSEIKRIEAEEEKERAQKIAKATRSGDLSQMKRVWNNATDEELGRMKTTLKTRDEIDAISKARKENRRAEKVATATRTGDVEKMKKIWATATVDELKDMKQTLVFRNEIENFYKDKDKKK